MLSKTDSSYFSIYEEPKHNKMCHKLLKLVLLITLITSTIVFLTIIINHAKDYQVPIVIYKSDMGQDYVSQQADDCPKLVSQVQLLKDKDMTSRALEHGQKNAEIRLLVGENPQQHPDHLPGPSKGSHQHDGQIAGPSHDPTGQGHSQHGEGSHMEHSRSSQLKQLMVYTQKGNLILNGDFQQSGRDGKKYGEGESKTIEFQKGNSKSSILTSWDYDKIEVDAHIVPRNKLWLKGCTCFFRPNNWISQKIKMAVGVLYTVHWKSFSLQQNLQAKILIDEKPIYMFDSKGPFLQSQSFFFMVEGKQVNGEPYEVDENGREKKKIEPVDKKAELKEVTFKILVQQLPNTGVPAQTLKKEDMGFGITDIMILEATEAEIREQHKGLGRMIKSRKGNNFFANRQFTEITPEFTYTSWQGNFGIVDVPVKPKSPKKVPVIVLNSWRQTISQEIQGLRTGCRFKIKVVTDDRQGLSLNNDIEIIVDSVVLLKGTIEGGRRLFTAEFVAVKQNHRIEIKGKLGKPSSNKVKQLGTALLKLQLELLVDSMPKTGSHSTEVVYHPPSSQHKEDKKDGHTSGSTEHITTRSGKHSMAASGHGQRGGTGMQMGDISQQSESSHQSDEVDHTGVQTRSGIKRRHSTSDITSSPSTNLNPDLIFQRPKRRSIIDFLRGKRV